MTKADHEVHRVDDEDRGDGDQDALARSQRMPIVGLAHDYFGPQCEPASYPVGQTTQF